MKIRYDAVVVGSGPNGLAAAINLARQGLSVALFEKNKIPGGGARSEELTLPGFIHDVCSSVHPLGIASPFFKSLPLEKHGLQWIYSPAEVAHPFDDGSSSLLKRSVEETASLLGRDEKAYIKFFKPFALRCDELMAEIFSPTFHVPKNSLLFLKFGLSALNSAKSFAYSHFREEKTRALCLGIAAHSASPLGDVVTSSVGLALQIAGHGGGWPFPRGGSKNLSGALISYFRDLGGDIFTDVDVVNVDDLPQSSVVLLDLTPRQILKIAGPHLSRHLNASLTEYKYGPGVFKLDWALSAPIPWKSEECKLAATVHLGGRPEELILSEDEINHGRISQKPYVLLTQPSLFDAARAPSGSHVAWGYCHVPHGSSGDATDLIENQIERFAPGFKKIILKRSKLFPKDLEARNQNLIGGDISAGQVNAKQLFFRPRVTLNPYALDGKRFWICSAATPPGPGVHGMCGYNASEAALKAMLP